MSDGFVQQAALVIPPGAGSRSSVLANTALATAIDLNSFAGQWVAFKATVKTHVRFASTTTGATPTTTDWYMTADVDYPFYIPANGARRYLKHKGAGSTGNLHYVKMDGET